MLHYALHSKQAFLMTTISYQINNRQLTAFAPIAEELSYESNKNYLFDLAYLASIHIAGERAQEFLQGQLSCDVRNVNHYHMQQGAMCDLKGRILALLDVVDWQEHGIQLILPRDLLLSTKASLAKTAMFSRVTLQPSDYRIFGFYLQNENDSIPFDIKLSNASYSVMSGEGYCCYCLGNNFYLLLVENARVPLLQKFSTCKQERGSLAWHALQLQQKRIEIYPESRGLFLPHRLGLQLSGYLSFDKGCYKGQEIIARTHYRAKLKHELKLFKILTTATLHAGQKIINDDNIEIAELVDFCPTGKDEYLIAASMLFDHPLDVFIEGHKERVTMKLL